MASRRKEESDSKSIYRTRSNNNSIDYFLFFFSLEALYRRSANLLENSRAPSIFSVWDYSKCFITVQHVDPYNDNNDSNRTFIIHPLRHRTHQPPAFIGRKKNLKFRTLCLRALATTVYLHICTIFSSTNRYQMVGSFNRRAPKDDDNSNKVRASTCTHELIKHVIIDEWN